MAKRLTVGTSVFVATLTLHEERGANEKFFAKDIYNCVIKQEIYIPESHKSIMDLIYTTGVANREAANPCYPLVLWKEGRQDETKKYRLFCKEVDKPHGKIKRKIPYIPPKYLELYEWYCSEKSLSQSVTDGSKLANTQNQHRVADNQASLSYTALTSSRTEDCVEHNKNVKQKIPGFENSDNPPPKITEAVTRFIRDRKTVKDLKNRYQDKCQVCGCEINIPTGKYSEVHHLHPLGEGGADNHANMLVLCPTHHVEFDYAALGILDDRCSVVDMDGNVRKLGVSRHDLGLENIRHHRGRMERAGALKGNPPA